MMTVMCVNFNKGLLFRVSVALLEKPGDSDTDLHIFIIYEKNNPLVPILMAVFQGPITEEKHIHHRVKEGNI